MRPYWFSSAQHNGAGIQSFALTVRPRVRAHCPRNVDTARGRPLLRQMGIAEGGSPSEDPQGQSVDLCCPASGARGRSPVVGPSTGTGAGHRSSKRLPYARASLGEASLTQPGVSTPGGASPGERRSAGTVLACRAAGAELETAVSRFADKPQSGVYTRMAWCGSDLHHDFYTVTRFQGCKEVSAWRP
jgi:hypothetical protein